MAARRGKTQARRNSGNGTPGWVWLVVGVLLASALFFFGPSLLNRDRDGFFKPKPNPDALPAQVGEADEPVASSDPVTATPAPAAEKPVAAAKPQYDFYTLLPGKETPMSDAELAESARAEATRAAKAGRAVPTPIDAAGPDAATPATTTTTASAATLPAGTTAPATATTATSATSSAPAATSGPAAAERAASTPASDSSARYILQAGAFGASGDAEALKAKIALLGLSARVESAEIKGKTLYRVRMGPYGTASELAEAKQALSSAGQSAMAIKAQ